MIILSNQLEENRLNLSILSVIFLFLNEEFIEMRSGKMQYKKANINLKITLKIDLKIKLKIGPNL